MSPSPTADFIRRDLRRKTIWLAAGAAFVAALDILLLPSSSSFGPRLAYGIAAVAVDLGAVWFLGNRFLRRPLLAAIEALEFHARAAEAQREQAERLAGAGRVAAGVAHEIGNPLCAIINYAYTLEEKVPPELRGTVKSLQREAARIERIAAGFVEHAKPRDPGALGADVRAAIGEALGFLGDQGVLRRVEVERKLDERSLLVPGTALELEQTIANLVLNAVDAMPAGGRLVVFARRMSRGEILDPPSRRSGDSAAVPEAPARRREQRLIRWLAGFDEAEFAKIVVADSGHGVRHGEEERIFEPFVTTKTDGRGSGLGLSVVRRMVDSMGGLIWVQPSREGGAAFHIVLPLFAQARGAPGQAQIR